MFQNESLHASKSKCGSNKWNNRNTKWQWYIDCKSTDDEITDDIDGINKTIDGSLSRNNTDIDDTISEPPKTPQKLM